jgi:hypothetical protein
MIKNDIKLSTFTLGLDFTAAFRLRDPAAAFGLVFLLNITSEFRRRRIDVSVF